MTSRARARLDIVYEGPGYSGRQTSARFVSACLGASPPTLEVTEQKRIARFTWATNELEIAVHALTGALHQPATAAELCERASAIVFVADSQEPRLVANEWIGDLIYERVGRTKPVVLQFNKRDLVRQGIATPVAELSRKLNRFDAREYETIAPKGIGVWDAFVAAAMLGARAQGIESLAAAALTSVPGR